MSETIWHRLTHGARRLFQRPEWTSVAGPDWSDHIMGVEVTDRFHAKQGRSTGRWLLRADGREVAVYLKRHYALPWWRGMLATLWPSRGWSPGMREWRHLEWARRQGILVPKPVAVAEYIGPWGRLQSILAIEELEGMVPLHLAVPAAARHLNPRTFRRWKRGLIAELARIAHHLHQCRFFHKDFYLCHFFIPESLITESPSWQGRIYLIDLHRLAKHPRTWPLWQIKDLAQLLYSSETHGIDDRDRLLFWRMYWGEQRHARLAKWIASCVRFKRSRYQRHNLKKSRLLAAEVSAK